MRRSLFNLIDLTSFMSPGTIKDPYQGPVTKETVMYMGYYSYSETSGLAEISMIYSFQCICILLICFNFIKGHIYCLSYIHSDIYLFAHFYCRTRE